MKNIIPKSTVIAFLMTIAVACQKPSYFGKSNNLTEPVEAFPAGTGIQKSDEVNKIKTGKGMEHLDYYQREPEELAQTKIAEKIVYKQPVKRQHHNKLIILVNS